MNSAKPERATPPNVRATIAERRRHGRFYTPAWLAKEMLADIAGAWETEHGASLDAPPTILDPACGDGVFLLAAFDRFAGADWRERFRLVEHRLFGVDNDDAAIARLRASLLERIDPPADARPDVTAALERNFLCGDALTGPDLGLPAQITPLSPRLGAGRAAGVRGVNGSDGTDDSSHSDSPEPIDNQARIQGSAPSPPAPLPRKAGGEGGSCVAVLNWQIAFPAIARAGGFDLVVGNPPYLRELNAREQFERVARSPLGLQWRQARMDFWHYFVHRGLDLLRPGGRLAFVVNGYWTAASGASKLIRRIEAETTLERLRLFEKTPLFEDVSGRHMTFQLRKGRTDTSCVVHDGDGEFRLGLADAFRGGRLLIARPDATLEIMGRGEPLRTRFEVRQGIAENPPVITARHCRGFPGRFQPGEGVFLLTPSELERLDLSPHEQSLLRHYYRAAQLERFVAPRQCDSFLLYLTRETAPDLTALPAIARHLNRFHPLLKRRREVGRGVMAWWHLHWPREERLFVEPRILAAQMGRTPRFAVAHHPTFVGFALNLIRPRATEKTALESENGEKLLSLDALTGVLNSSLASRWFDRHAKHRGVHLDISGEVLSQFPLPPPDNAMCAEMERLVQQRASLVTGDHPDQIAELESIENAVNDLVSKWYGLP